MMMVMMTLPMTMFTTGGAVVNSCLLQFMQQSIVHQANSSPIHAYMVYHANSSIVIQSNRQELHQVTSDNVSASVLEQYSCQCPHNLGMMPPAPHTIYIAMQHRAATHSLTFLEHSCTAVHCNRQTTTSNFKAALLGIVTQAKILGSICLPLIFWTIYCRFSSLDESFQACSFSGRCCIK